MKIKDLIYIPFHDWRKIMKEGNRTRDAHFIEKFRLNNDIGKLIIVNRPITKSELLVKKRTVNRNIDGKIVFESNGGILYQIDRKTYVIDYLLSQNLQHLQLKRKWYFNAFGNSDFIQFYKDCIDYLNIENAPIISANIFSANFILSIKNRGNKVIFDAWDNFYLIPGLKSIKKEVFNAYKIISQNVNQWVTNSEENKLFFKQNFNVNNIKIIKNGVDNELFKRKFPIPKDLKEILQKNKKPLIGFGGKITHLFDVDLFNYLTEDNRNYTFVIIGQILNKKIFSKINFSENVHYLGDKKYDIYLQYMTHFDIGIVPYLTDKDQHGGDSIKVYEYLSANLPVVGTRGNGLEFLEEYIYLSESKKEFSKLLKKATVIKKFPAEQYSWKNKEIELLSLLKNK